MESAMAPINVMNKTNKDDFDGGIRHRLTKMGNRWNLARAERRRRDAWGVSTLFCKRIRGGTDSKLQRLICQPTTALSSVNDRGLTPNDKRHVIVLVIAPALRLRT